MMQNIMKKMMTKMMKEVMKKMAKKMMKKMTKTGHWQEQLGSDHSCGDAQGVL